MADYGTGNGTMEERFRGRTVRESEDRVSDPVPVPEDARVPVTGGPTAIVERNLGVTLNLGQYRSLRADWKVTLPCKLSKDAIEKTAKFADDWVSARINQDVAEWTGDTAIKYLPADPDADSRKKR